MALIAPPGPPAGTAPDELPAELTHGVTGELPAAAFAVALTPA